MTNLLTSFVDVPNQAGNALLCSLFVISYVLLTKNCAVKLFINFRLPAWLVLLLVLGTTSCTSSHHSLSRKTSWYKHHSGGKSTPCPCGH